MTTFAHRSKAILLDHRAGFGHVCLYLALLIWQEARQGQRVLYVERREMMKLAKIRSEKTFYKALRELGEWGYVRAEMNKREPSRLRLL